MTDDVQGEIKFDWRSFTPDDSPKTPVDLRRDPTMRDLSTADLGVGDMAHDFKLQVFDFASGTERATGDTFHLFEVARDRPVALIFGSYT